MGCGGWGTRPETAKASARLPVMHSESSASPNGNADPSGSVRNGAIDVLRFLAAAGVVWIHAPQSFALIGTANIGRFAVPFFAASALYFALDSVSRRATGWIDYVRSRLVRIVAPYLIWLGIYLVALNVKYRMAHQPFVSFEWRMLYNGGPAYHLWFLPFVFVLSCVLFPIGVRLRSGSNQVRLVTGAIALVAGIATGLFPAPKLGGGENLVALVVQSYATFPAACWAVTLASWNRFFVPQSPRRAVAWLGGLVTCACTTYVVHIGRMPLLENVAGIACLLTGLTARAAVSASWTLLGEASYGIYLLHVLVLLTLRTLLGCVGIGNTGPADLLVFVSTLCVSTLAAVWLARTRLGSWLIGQPPSRRMHRSSPSHLQVDT
jgi:peptidoglycan/LPS O-acetylase OafA/YrhL